jgi:hypothetical protein
LNRFSRLIVACEKPPWRRIVVQELWQQAREAGFEVAYAKRDFDSILVRVTVTVGASGCLWL